MELSNTNHAYRQMMDDLFSIGTELGTKTYLWGGFAQDILCSQFLREHGDLDAFTENLDDLKGPLMALLRARRYDCVFNETFSMLEVTRNGVHASINPLRIHHSVAQWKHIGELGSVFFPQDWLGSPPWDFAGVPVYIAGPRFEYAFRKLVRQLNPEWQPREKDKTALEFYEAYLRRENIDRSGVLAQFWSYNPFWLSKGYDGFQPPVLVVGKDFAERLEKKKEEVTPHGAQHPEHQNSPGRSG